jgi:hypothetical protein
MFSLNCIRSTCVDIPLTSLPMKPVIKPTTLQQIHSNSSMSMNSSLADPYVSVTSSPGQKQEFLIVEDQPQKTVKQKLLSVENKKTASKTIPMSNISRIASSSSSHHRSGQSKTKRQTRDDLVEILSMISINDSNIGIRSAKSSGSPIRSSFSKLSRRNIFNEDSELHEKPAHLWQVFANKSAKHAFRNFLRSKFAQESLSFFETIQMYKQLNDHVQRDVAANGIVKRFLSDNSKYAINVSYSDRIEILDRLENGEHWPEDAFDNIMLEVYYLMSRNFFHDFIEEYWPRRKSTRPGEIGYPRSSSSEAAFLDS